MAKRKKECEVCSSRGYLLMWRETDILEIQKCDSCDICKTDNEATQKCHEQALVGWQYLQAVKLGV